jgi:hypothetical protein
MLHSDHKFRRSEWVAGNALEIAAPLPALAAAGREKDLFSNVAPVSQALGARHR